MITKDEAVVIRAISICFKPYLKTEEALIYCNLGRTQFSKKCDENRIYKNNNGYFKRKELDRMMEGEVREKTIKLNDLRRNKEIQ